MTSRVSSLSLLFLASLSSIVVSMSTPHAYRVFDVLALMVAAYAWDSKEK
jgi:hypothetical protein